MTESEFKEQSSAQGFETFVVVEREPNGVLGEHSHPFEARALILDGEITIISDGKLQRCGPGDTFQLARDIVHTESYGPQGVRYLAARK